MFSFWFKLSWMFPFNTCKHLSPPLVNLYPADTQFSHRKSMKFKMAHLNKIVLILLAMKPWTGMTVDLYSQYDVPN